MIVLLRPNDEFTKISSNLIYGSFSLAGLVADEAALRGRKSPLSSRRDAGGRHRKRFETTGALVFCLLLTILCGVTRADEPVYGLDIPAMNAAEALNRFAEQTGAIMLFPYELASARQANAVTGRYTLLEGLDLLLQGTGLSGGLSDKRVVSISLAENEQRLEGEGAMSAQNVPLRRKITAFVASIFSVSTAFGQDTDIGTQPLEEIIVTAQKREQRLMDVPMSVAVIGSQEIDRRGLVNRSDYMRSIPSVALRDEGPGLAEIVIRGAYGDRFYTGPTVGLYFGDVPLTGFALGGSADVKLVDIARVEVLRGPQGTLYGSNALSGAIRYIPVAPDLRAFEGRVNLGTAHTARHGGTSTALEGVINVPLVEDELAVRAVGYRHSGEGYVRNVAGNDAALQETAALFGAGELAINKNHVGNTRYSGGRISALWHPTGQLSLNLTYLKQRDSQDDRLFELPGFGPYQRSDFQFGDIIGGNEDALRLDLDVLNLTGEYDFGWGTLYSSTAWIDQQFIRKWDIGAFLGSPLKPIPQVSTTNASVFTEEIRLTSELAGPFQFVAGLYYEDSEQPTLQHTFFAGDAAANPFAAVKLFDTFHDRRVTQKAAFGELSYDVTENIVLTAGGRYFKYDTRFIDDLFNSVLLLESSSDNAAGESGSTFKAVIEYTPKDDVLFYATWSQGFRLGRPLSTDLIRAICDTDSDGFLDGTDIPSDLDRVTSDRLDNYEVGAKLAFMGGRVTINSAVYQNNWKDIPVGFIPPGCLTSTTINGGRARAIGFESEGSVQLIDGLRVNFGFGYVDSKLTATTSAGSKGDRMNFTPEHNGNLGLEYEFRFAGHKAFVRGDYYYFGSYYTQTGERGLRADSYSLVNLRTGMMLFDGLDVHLHVDNALNSDAFTSVLGPSGIPPGYKVRLRPRTIGVGVAYRF